MNILVSAFAHVPGANPAAAAINGMLRALSGSIDAVTLKAPGEAHVQRMGSGKLLRVPVRGDAEDMRAAFARALVRQFEAEIYDVVHVRSAYEGAVFTEYRETQDFKLVYEISSFPPHDAPPRVIDEWSKAHQASLSAADAIVVPTEAASRSLIPVTQRPKTTVIPPGVNVDEYDWFESERDETLRLLFLGHFSPDRDLDTILSATREVQGERQVALLLAGEPDPHRRAIMRELVAEHELTECVHVRGAPLPRSIPRLIAACDVALVPATATNRFQQYGDLPQPLLEYMACRCPIVGAGVPGIAEVLRDEKEGLLYSPGDAMSLADAIRTLASDRQFCRRVSHAAYERARSEFSSSRRRRAIRALYAQLAPTSQPEDLWEQAFDGPATSAVTVETPPDENTELSHLNVTRHNIDLMDAGDDFALGPEWFIEAETTSARSSPTGWDDQADSEERPALMEAPPPTSITEEPS